MEGIEEEAASGAGGGQRNPTVIEDHSTCVLHLIFPLLENPLGVDVVV